MQNQIETSGNIIAVGLANRRHFDNGEWVETFWGVVYVLECVCTGRHQAIYLLDLPYLTRRLHLQKNIHEPVVWTGSVHSHVKPNQAAVIDSGDFINGHQRLIVADCDLGGNSSIGVGVLTLDFMQKGDDP